MRTHDTMRPVPITLLGHVEPVPHPRTTAVFVLGCLSLVLPPLGPVAWVMGVFARRDVDHLPQVWCETPMLQAGRVLGTCMTMINAMLVVVMLTAVLV